MKHTLEITRFPENEFLIIQEEENNLTTIRIVNEKDGNKTAPEILQTTISKKELHSFIGALLHVQSKLK